MTGGVEWQESTITCPSLAVCLQLDRCLTSTRFVSALFRPTLERVALPSAGEGDW